MMRTSKNRTSKNRNSKNRTSKNRNSKNRNSKNRNSKNRNRKNKTKAKGLTRNLNEKIFLIKKLPLSEDLTRKITETYILDMIIEKINRYILIVDEIIYQHMEYNYESRTYHEAQELLSDFGYDYISKIELLNNEIKKLKSKRKKDLSKEDIDSIKEDIDSINRLLSNYYREIDSINELEFINGQYKDKDKLFIKKLDNFLDNRENQND
jgi:hypothetical protein